MNKNITEDKLCLCGVPEAEHVCTLMRSLQLPYIDSEDSDSQFPPATDNEMPELQEDDAKENIYYAELVPIFKPILPIFLSASDPAVEHLGKFPALQQRSHPPQPINVNRETLAPCRDTLPLFLTPYARPSIIKPLNIRPRESGKLCGRPQVTQPLNIRETSVKPLFFSSRHSPKPLSIKPQKLVRPLRPAPLKLSPSYDDLVDIDSSSCQLRRMSRQPQARPNPLLDYLHEVRGIPKHAHSAPRNILKRS